MRELNGTQQKILFIIMLLWAVFVIFTAKMPFHVLIQAPTYMGFALVLAFALYPMKKNSSQSSIPVVDWVCIGLTVIAVFHICVNHEEILLYPATSNMFELIMGGLLILLVMEACRRTMGPIIPILSIILILYTIMGRYVPSPWGHRGVSFQRMIEYLYLSTTGYWGTISYIMSTIIAIFMVFGGVLLETGGGKALIHIVTVVGGRLTGGGAKVALFASAVAGTMQGSSVSNVVSTGVFTIPLMKGQGFKSEFAAAAEAAASTGGQIMPPIMGAGAFLMAEFLGIPYLSVCKAAIIPAILYFSGVFFGIHFRAKKQGLGKLDPEEIKKSKKMLTWSNILPLFVPVTVLIILLVKGFTPQFSAFYSVLSALILFLCFTNKWGTVDIKNRFIKIANAMVFAAKMLIGVSCLIICVQIMIGLISMTGIGVKLSQAVISLGGENIGAAIIIAAVSCLIMGMGMPTTAAYVLAATVMGTALIKIGVLPLAAHFIIFYYAILSVISPPVCAAVYAGSALAESEWLPTAWIAVRLALPAYLVPFMFAYNPAYLMIGHPIQILLAFVSGFVGVLCLAASLMGYFLKPANWFDRILLFTGAMLLLVPDFTTDFIGIGLAIIAVISQKVRKR